MEIAEMSLGGTEVKVSHDGLWLVEAGGNSAEARYLDGALESALPKVPQRIRDRLLLQLLC